MNIVSTFLELDKLYESVDYYSRQELIDNLKALNRYYDFDRFSDRQLYRIWQKAEQQEAKKIAYKDYAAEKEKESSYRYCDMCSTRLNPLDQCPICDLGDTLDEDFISRLNTLGNTTNWVDSANNVVTPAQLNRSQGAVTATPATVPPSASNISATNNSSKFIVTIIRDSNKLRAQATDGVHPVAWVAFPNHLRNYAGQQYEVEQLIWNGKNYRVSGNITPI